MMTKATANRRPAPARWLRQASSIQRTRIWHHWRKNHMRLEATAARRVFAVLESLAVRTVTRLRIDGLVLNPRVVMIESEYRDELSALLLLLLLRGTHIGYEFELEWIRNAAPKTPRLPAIASKEIPAGIIVPARRWIDGKVELIWRNQYDAIARRVESELKRVVDEGLPQKKALSRVRKRMQRANQVVARETARTQTTGGMNNVQQLTRTEFGIAHKEWVSTIDNRTRPGYAKNGKSKKGKFNHRKPDGQIVLNGAAFEVSGERLMFPTDTTLGASLGNIINCRCVSVAAFPN